MGSQEDSDKYILHISHVLNPFGVKDKGTIECQIRMQNPYKETDIKNGGLSVFPILLTNWQRCWWAKLDDAFLCHGPLDIIQICWDKSAHIFNAVSCHNCHIFNPNI